MNSRVSRNRSAHESAQDDTASQHITFSAGAARAAQNGEIFKLIRQQNLDKTAAARVSRPHKTA